MATKKEDLTRIVKSLNTLLEFHKINKVYEIGYRNGYVYLDRLDLNDHYLCLGTAFVGTKKEVYTFTQTMCQTLQA